MRADDDSAEEEWRVQERVKEGPDTCVCAVKVVAPVDAACPGICALHEEQGVFAALHAPGCRSVLARWPPLHGDGEGGNAAADLQRGDPLHRHHVEVLGARSVVVVWHPPVGCTMMSLKTQ